MKLYPKQSPKTIEDVLDFIRYIQRERKNDVNDFTLLREVYIAGRKVEKIPVNATDTNDGDREGDFNYDNDYIYICVDVSGTLTWRTAPLTDFTGGGGGGGESNTASNLGTTTYGLFTTKSGVDLPFKSLTAGTNITLTASATEVEIAASGGGTTNNYYSSLAAPQLFNPDASGVSGGTDDFTLANSNNVAIVTVNGQTLDDSEYSLSTNVLTVTPDNGFTATSDEVLVFQEEFTFDLSSSVTRVTTTATIGNSAKQWNGNTDGGGFTVTLPAGVQGEEYKVVNTGTSGNTLTVAPDGSEDLLGVNSNFNLADGESLIIAYDTTDGWY